jgi:hypothetical protein
LEKVVDLLVLLSLLFNFSNLLGQLLECVLVVCVLSLELCAMLAVYLGYINGHAGVPCCFFELTCGWLAIVSVAMKCGVVKCKAGIMMLRGGLLSATFLAKLLHYVQRTQLDASTQA